MYQILQKFNMKMKQILKQITLKNPLSDRFPCIPTRELDFRYTLHHLKKHRFQRAMRNFTNAYFNYLAGICKLVYPL